MGRFTRITQGLLVLNALGHGSGTVGFLAGLGRAAGEPFMGRRAGAAGLAGCFMLLFVAKRIARDPWLILLPLTFVLGNLTVTLYDFSVTSDRKDLAPFAPELTFLLAYCAYALTRLRKPEPVVTG